MRKLAKRIRGVSDRYTGDRWFQGLNITNLGEPVGVGSTTQMASMGQSYQMRWVKGVVQRVNVFTDGTLSNYKVFTYDSVGRVIENRMYSPDGTGGWAIIEDVWFYKYDPVTGVRSDKIIRFLGENTYRVVRYDKDGFPTEEFIETEAGQMPDRTFPYARKTFRYDEEHNPTEERWYNESGTEIEVKKP